MTVRAMSKFCDGVFGWDSNFYFQPRFDCRYIILFLNFTVVLTLHFWPVYILVMIGKINYFSVEVHITLYSSSLRKC
jgi:hypothetical protein